LLDEGSADLVARGGCITGGDTRSCFSISATDLGCLLRKTDLTRAGGGSSTFCLLTGRTSSRTGLGVPRFPRREGRSGCDEDRLVGTSGNNSEAPFSRGLPDRRDEFVRAVMAGMVPDAHRPRPARFSASRGG
jgi:hypothetical protein